MGLGNDSNIIPKPTRIGYETGPPAMNRAERIFRLHRCLKSRQPPSLAKLMDELEASRATINRDLEYMRLHMGAPITYDRDTNSASGEATPTNCRCRTPTRASCRWTF